MTEEEKKKTKLTPQQIMEAKDAFNIFDRNSHVKVSENELVTVMRSLRQNLSQKEVKELISTLDLDNLQTYVRSTQ
ncbi:EF hand family protein [Trichomonas vaginalis G3]|uniref:EF hand family protein n=1 Tax=Trichomonas vaginalis (strain ATCC PRA-98 / G3) TaxID=412133 RepID=A2FJN7_TRIV3|nr:calcium-binding protein family [Trichomonas vaginalis G3]EAX94869.1 EF hand family protein [Trichomonas vaginalis G3]KAI5541507.1 calcium-binding protein family [Trichomonas vaginalis G3]|eukprot:XP_001307799.1 EF hand family protein [Trichomonas vaginalis G3]